MNQMVHFITKQTWPEVKLNAQLGVLIASVAN